MDDTVKNPLKACREKIAALREKNRDARRTYLLVAFCSCFLPFLSAFWLFFPRELYHHPDWSFLFTLSQVLILFALCFPILCWARSLILNMIAAIAITFFATSLLIPCLLFGAFSVDSLTYDPANYGVYNDYVDVMLEYQLSNASSIMPKTLPAEEDRLAESDIRYRYYAYKHIDPAVDIYAEWSLTDEAFAYEIARVKAIYEENFAGVYRIVETEGFTCLVQGHDTFGEANENQKDFFHYIFAYNEETNRVRYVIAYYMAPTDSKTPYYTELSW